MENYNDFEEAFGEKAFLPEEEYVDFYGPFVGTYYWNGLTEFQRSKIRHFYSNTKRSDFEDHKRKLKENGEICIVFPDTVVSDDGVRHDNFALARIEYTKKYDNYYYADIAYVPADINHMKMYRDKKYDYVNKLKSKLLEYEKKNNIVRNLEDYSVEISYGKNMDLSNCDEKEKQNIDFYINQVIKNVIKEPNTPDGTSDVCFQYQDGEIVLHRELIEEGNVQKIVTDNAMYFVWKTTDEMKNVQSCILTDDRPMYFVGGSSIKGKYIVISVRRYEKNLLQNINSRKKIVVHVMYGEKYN